MFSHPIPNKEFSFYSSTGYFIFKNATSVDVTDYSWDQNTDWSNYLDKKYQDIYVETAPKVLEEDFYLGYGYWVCGNSEPQQRDDEVSKELLKKKKYVEKRENQVSS